MLEYNEILPKKVILLDGEPYEVLDAHVFRKQQRKPVNQTKLRNIISGKVTERSFHVSEKADEAELTTREIKYLYENRGEYWFCTSNDPKNRFSLSRDILGFPGQFMKQNSLIEALIFNEKIISVRVPIKVTLKVTDAPPAVRGNTSQGGTKQIVLETDATVQAPLFIQEGESVIVNTQTGEYVERG